MRCGDCRFFVRCEMVTHLPYETYAGPAPVGQCRRYPPSLSNDPETEIVGKWPCIDEDNWCGEHEPREAGKVGRG